MRATNIFDKVDAYSESREAKKAGIYPFFRTIVSEQDTEVTLENGRKVLMLGSNSYMGLTNHPEVKAAAEAAIRKYGTGCAGSPFLNGTLDIHEELAKDLADWVGKEQALLFSTGFQANLGLISTIVGRHDHVIMDKQDHASIYDGAKLSLAKPERYPHNDMDALDRILADLPEDQGKLIVADGVFSMEGDIIRLPELVVLAEKHRAVIMIDDAHALGVLGREGAGTSAHFGLTDRVDFIMGTFSKSLAAIGGFVAGDEQAIEYLKHHARPHIFSASMPPASAAAALAALKIVRREPQRIERLWRNTSLMREGLKALGYNTGFSETPIIPVHVGDVLKLVHMNKRLEEEGLFVNPVVPPAVPPNDCLLRISLMATHTEAQIALALDKMAQVGRELGVI
ncbi:MAG: aminotransferase class I/II-fold pyridoxal phosphate-dependent enzyme [Thermodesulfobacteriota bacterium]